MEGRGGTQGVQTGNACIVCWKSPTDRAHLIDRSLVPDRHWDPARIVFLCREHHDAYDAHELDLLPYLEARHRHELARAVECFGLLATLERVTGKTWLPAGDPAPWEEANATLKHRVRELEATHV